MDDNRKNSFGNEAAGFGERVSGATKAAVGKVTGDESLRERGNAENLEGRERMDNSDIGERYDAGRANMVTGLFRDRESAERAYSSINTRGYGKDDVNLLMSEETRNRYFGNNAPSTDLGDKALEGAGVGSAIGGTVGAVLAAIAAIGTSVLIPGLGLVVAGPLAAALAGAGAGGLTGGLVGALVGAGIPEDRAKAYDEGIRNGGIVMGVNPRSPEDAEYFEREFRTHRGENIYR